MTFRINMHRGLYRQVLSWFYEELFSDSRFLGDGDEWLAFGRAAMSFNLLLKFTLCQD